jgi:hypothetical protein
MQNAKWKTFRSVSPNHDASASWMPVRYGNAEQTYSIL